MINKKTYIRPYKWSSWDCEVWVRGENDKAYIFAEQKWADIGIMGEYSLTPIQFHSELGWVNPKDFMMDKQNDSDLVFVIDGDSYTAEADDVYYSVEFNGNLKLRAEYTELASKCDHDGEHELLEELGYKQIEGYHIVKFNQRELGK